MGYLGVILPETDYRSKQLIGAATGTAFKPFIKPVPDTTADDDTHKEQQRALREYLVVDAKLKQLIVQAVDDTYYTAFDNFKWKLIHTSYQYDNSFKYQCDCEYYEYR